MVAIVTSSGIDSDMRELEVASSMNNVSYYSGMHRATMLTDEPVPPALSGICLHKYSANIPAFISTNTRKGAVGMASRLLAWCPENRYSIPGGDKKCTRIYSSLRPNRFVRAGLLTTRWTPRAVPRNKLAGAPI
jgi:hypothetical protein